MLQQMTFCPQCGQKLMLHEIGGRERPQCDPTQEGCGFVDFGRYLLGVGGLVVQQNTDGEEEVLLIQRNEEPAKGRWTIPGGYVEYDETAEVGIVREIWEETGLECEIEGLVGYRNRIERGANTSYVVFKLKIVGGELNSEPSPEIAQVRFYTQSALRVLPDLSPFSLRLALAALDRSFQLLSLTEIPSVFDPQKPIKFFM